MVRLMVQGLLRLRLSISVGVLSKATTELSVALLLDGGSGGRRTEHRLTTLPLLAEALLGIQPLQPALRPAIQGDGVGAGVGGSLAGRACCVCVHGQRR